MTALARGREASVGEARASTHSSLVLWVGAVAALWLIHPPRTSWHFFHDAAGMLIGRAQPALGAGGLHLWQSQPAFQFGPITVVAALVLRAIAGSGDVWVARALLAPIPIALVWLVEDAALASSDRRPARFRRNAALLGGFVLVPVWDYLAIASVHLDDALALLAAVIAVWAVARHRPWIVAIALGVAANAKPWAIVFLPLALAPAIAPRRMLLVATGVAFLPWLPFFLASPRTLAALRSFRIHNMHASALWTLGFHSSSTPAWDRPAQMALGLGASVLAVRSGRWPGVLLAGLAVRLLLDPGAHLYYSAGLVLAALVWEVVATDRRIPWFTALTAAMLQLPRLFAAPVAISGSFRLVATVGALVVVFIPQRTSSDRSPPHPEEMPRAAQASSYAPSRRASASSATFTRREPNRERS